MASRRPRAGRHLYGELPANSDRGARHWTANSEDDEKNELSPLSNHHGMSRDDTSFKANNPGTLKPLEGSMRTKNETISTPYSVFADREPEQAYSYREDTSENDADKDDTIVSIVSPPSEFSYYHPEKRRRPRPRKQLLLTSHVSHPSRSREDDLLDKLEALRLENERLKAGVQAGLETPAPLAYRPHVFYCLNGTEFYLDEPRWEAGDYRPVLRSSNPVRNVDYYIDQHPEIAFYFEKHYSSEVPKDLSLLETSDGVFRKPVPQSQTLSLVADAMIDAVEDFVRRVPNFRAFFRSFDPRGEIKEPYLFMFYSIPFMRDAMSHLDPQSRKLFELLYKSIDRSHGLEYDSARKYESEAMTSSRLVQYLVYPGEILVELAGPNTRAYMALDWAEPDFTSQTSYEEALAYQRTKGKSKRADQNYAESLVFSWKVPVAYWSFDGNFERTEETLSLTLKVGYEDETVPIDTLNYVPLEYTPPRTRETLERRGATFWSLRFGKYVTYRKPSRDNMDNTEERYFVDISTYKKLHPHSSINQIHLRPDFNAKEMASDEPPAKGLHLLLFPSVIPGYNMLQKIWSDLYVDYIYDIDWNKQAFKDLVVDDEIKELVQALVTKQIATRKSTDSISGKGNGLILLLHGAPGTGKTFTAEGVAEFAEKPLFRVTCGDVGIEATEVEKYLQAAFSLGKLWDCVVLLDEADVFLEERDVRDLNRNALVSVFLRALEYHDGILILTSNRVGTFDEAFKSRIQLALHYENLTLGQRRKIWRNFMTRLKLVDAENVDYEDILDHLEDLGKVDINGREIRNAITIARQLAQFKDEKFRYSHLHQVIRVSGKFDKYLKDLRDGLTEDHIKHDLGVRHSYHLRRSNSMS